MRNVVEGPSSTSGAESRGERHPLWVCNSVCIVHNVTEALGRGRGGKNRKNRDSRYSVTGAGHRKWPSPLRPPSRPSLLICAFEDANQFHVTD